MGTGVSFPGGKADEA